ncbi:MAG: hypothetical protein C7B46_19765 [Sulfobacillus benefaciens]|uniref:Uncharacterized protein n=1 Tax=Sulfobacillus benefaciens TaxID=453960 RepID=A0A2T2WWY3_9FIRM|nr:MAG: hypothetical protein C7B46_19765 [Sulfobacillus benefaciens]
MEAPVVGLLLFMDFVSIWGVTHHVMHIMMTPWWFGALGWVGGNILFALAWRLHAKKPTDVDVTMVAMVFSFPTSMAAGLMMEHWLSSYIIEIASGIWLAISLVLGSMAAFTHPRDGTASFVLGWGAFPLAMFWRILFQNNGEICDKGSSRCMDL